MHARRSLAHEGRLRANGPRRPVAASATATDVTTYPPRITDDGSCAHLVSSEFQLQPRKDSLKLDERVSHVTPAASQSRPSCSAGMRTRSVDGCRIQSW